MKICNKCNKKFRKIMFCRDSSKKDGLSTICKTCKKKYRMHTKLRKDIVAPKQKVCVACLKTKDKSEFHSNKSQRDGLVSRCKPCIVTKSKKYYDANKEEMKRKNREWHKNNRKRASARKMK